MIKKSIQIISLIIAVLILTTACSTKPNPRSTKTSVEQASETSVEQTSKSNTDKNKEKTNATNNHKKLSNLYTKILNNINSYSFTDTLEEENTNCTYTYALVNMNESDIPQLIVAQNTDYGLSYVKFFSSNNDFTKEITSNEILTIGVTSAGGFRAGITQNEKLDALIYTEISSGTGDVTREEITSSIENDNLKIERTATWEGKFDNLPETNFPEIKFNDISDRKSIEKLASITDGDFRKTITATNNEDGDEKEENSMESQIQAELNAGKIVVSGDVKIFNHQEMIEYQNLDPNMLPDMGESYVVLLLKDSVDINMHSGGGPGYITRPANIIGLPDDMGTYDGQNITISFSADDGHWQSDVSLPMDAPRMKQVKVLK